MNEFSNMDKPMTSMYTKGAFLTSGDNVMVCSWGFIGVMWGKRVVVAPIRDSRFTKIFVDKTKQFTVSVPEIGTMTDEMKFCGTKSGKDFDKWKEMNMEKLPAKTLENTFVVGGCQKYFECKVITCVDTKNTDLSMVENWYPTHDLHNFYIAEIVAEY